MENKNLISLNYIDGVIEQNKDILQSICYKMDNIDLLEKNHLKMDLKL